MTDEANKPQTVKVSPELTAALARAKADNEDGLRRARDGLKWAVTNLGPRFEFVANEAQFGKDKPSEDEVNRPAAAINAPGIGHPVDASGCLIGGPLRVSGYVVGTPLERPTAAQQAAQAIGFPGYEAQARFRVMGRPGCGRCYGSGAVPPMGEPCSCVGSGPNANQQEERAMGGIDGAMAAQRSVAAAFRAAQSAAQQTHVTISAAEWQAMRDQRDMVFRRAMKLENDISAVKQELVSAHATIDRLTTANAELGARVEALEDDRDGWGKAATLTKEETSEWLADNFVTVVTKLDPASHVFVDIPAALVPSPTTAPIPSRTLAVDDSAHGLRMPKGFW